MSLSVARAARVCGARPGYHRRMEDAANLVLVGPMGAGKSVAGARLATRLGRRFVDLDAVIQAEAGCSVAALFAAERTPLYEALADLRLHTDGLSTDQVVDALEALIRDRWPRAGVAA